MPKAASIAVVWALLVALLALTVVFSTVLSGPPGLVAGLVIATLKAGLVAWCFMRLDEQPPLIRLTAFVGSAWLAILFAMTALDYVTR